MTYEEVPLSGIQYILQRNHYELYDEQDHNRESFKYMYVTCYKIFFKWYVSILERCRFRPFHD